MVVDDAAAKVQPTLHRHQRVPTLATHHAFKVVARPALHHHQQVESDAMLTVVGLEIVFGMRNETLHLATQ